jgi:hypothetical protein
MAQTCFCRNGGLAPIDFPLFQGRRSMFGCTRRGRRTSFDLRTPDRHDDAAVTSLIPALSCRSCRPHAPFAELDCLSRTSIADEMRIEHTRRVLGE